MPNPSHRTRGERRSDPPDGWAEVRGRLPTHEAPRWRHLTRLASRSPPSPAVAGRRPNGKCRLTLPIPLTLAFVPCAEISTSRTVAARSCILVERFTLDQDPDPCVGDGDAVRPILAGWMNCDECSTTTQGDECGLISRDRRRCRVGFSRRSSRPSALVEHAWIMRASRTITMPISTIAPLRHAQARPTSRCGEPPSARKHRITASTPDMRRSDACRSRRAAAASQRFSPRGAAVRRVRAPGSDAIAEPAPHLVPPSRAA